MLRAGMLALTSHKKAALRAVQIERQGLFALEEALGRAEPGDLGAAFEEAVRVLAEAPGRVIVSGMGKSGLVARKVAATLASTGRPATFVHPAEASHGDLGMVQAGDVVVCLSWSGETAELADIINYTRRYRIPLIAITAAPGSTLACEADIRLVLPPAQEACPHGLAPTTSTTMQLVLGDALAMALMEAKGFTASDFGVFHPGGKLGARLVFVRDLMHKGDQVPRVGLGARMAEAVVEITQKRVGCVCVVDEGQRLVGLVTDGDLRRHMRSDLMDAAVAEIMTRSPRTIEPDALAAEALELISHNISVLPVVDENRKVIGVVHFHDLLRLGAA
ncbi:MAG TPA: KpsF/GutQ family sugar-phosphate isomerase [Roseiarcus sp.]|jgi:arabinose-5-phosphate isomerase|nr:KpsF/GutQ family sugar-phosphate isomerase [Roseiarcus sp.]